MTEGKTYHFGVDTSSAGTRLDLLIPRLLPDLSRSRGQQLIGAGLVTVNGEAAAKNHAVRGGDRLEITVPPPVPALPQAEAIPLEILYEDRDIVAVDKPAGMVVHPAPGHAGGTLVNALLAAVPTLSGIGGEVRPGIVHRLDKGTSGVVLVAKNDRAHRALAAQFAGRTVGKTYLSLAWGVLAENEGRCDTPIGRDAKDRQKISAAHPPPARRGHPLARAAAPPRRDARGAAPRDGAHAPDPRPPRGAGPPRARRPRLRPARRARSAYRRASVRHGFRDRLALHAWRLRFTPPSRRTPMEITAPPPPPELARPLPRRKDDERPFSSSRTPSSTSTARSTPCARTSRPPRRASRSPSPTSTSWGCRTRA